MKNSSILYGLAAAMAVFLCHSCVIIGMETMKNFSISDEIALQTPREDVLQIIEEVGNSLGYRVNARDKIESFSSVTFEKKTPFWVTMIISADRSATLIAMHDGLNNKIRLQMILVGNFGQGTENDARKSLQEFKDKLVERLH